MNMLNSDFSETEYIFKKYHNHPTYGLNLAFQNSAHLYTNQHRDRPS